MIQGRKKIFGLAFLMAVALSSPLRAEDDPILNGGGLLGQPVQAESVSSTTLPSNVQDDVDVQVSSLQGQVASLKQEVADLQKLQATDEVAFEAKLAQQQAEIDKLQKSQIAATSSASGVAATSSASGIASASSASGSSKPSRTSGLAGSIGKVDGTSGTTAGTTGAGSATNPSGTSPAKTSTGTGTTASSATPAAGSTPGSAAPGTTPGSTASKPSTTSTPSSTAAASQTPWWQTFLTSLLKGMSSGIQKYTQAKMGVIGNNANVASAQLGAQYPAYAPQINSQIQSGVGQAISATTILPPGTIIPPGTILPPGTIISPGPAPTGTQPTTARALPMRRAVLLPRVTDAAGTHPMINLELGTYDD